MKVRSYSVSNEVITSEEKKKKTRKTIMTIIFVLLNVGVIAWTAIAEFTKEKPKEYVFNFGIETAFFLICGVLCVILAELIESVKYHKMSMIIGEPVSLKHCVQVVFLGKYYDNITPSGSGGQPFQIYYLHKNKYSDGTSASLPLGGFFTIQIAFVILSIIVLITNARVVQTPYIIVLACIGTFTYSIVPFFIILFAINSNAAVRIIMFFVRLLNKMKIIKDVEKTKEKIVGSLSSYHDSMTKLWKNKWNMVLLLLMSIISKLLYCSIPYFVLLSFNGTSSLIDTLCITVIIYAAITIIPTPGNSGAAEASFYLVFSALDTGGVFWAMLIWRFICYYFYIFIGIGIYIYNAIKAKIDNKKNKVLSNVDKTANLGE